MFIKLKQNMLSVSRPRCRKITLCIGVYDSYNNDFSRGGIVYIFSNNVVMTEFDIKQLFSVQ